MPLTAEQCQRLEPEARKAPQERERAGKQPGHPEIDRRVLVLTRLAVARVDEDPALVQTGLDNIGRQARQNGGTLPQAYVEWQPLIRRHPRLELRRMLLKESDEGQQLRSSHPFTGLITPDDRARVPATGKPRAHQPARAGARTHLPLEGGLQRRAQTRSQDCSLDRPEHSPRKQSSGLPAREKQSRKVGNRVGSLQSSL